MKFLRDGEEEEEEEDDRQYLRLVGDEEAHVPAHVPVFYLGWGRADDLPGHFDAKTDQIIIVIISINIFIILRLFLAYQLDILYVNLS